MAEIEQGIYAKLSKVEESWASGNSWITDKWSGVSEYVGGRIFPNIAPLNASLPYLTYFKVSGVRIHAMGNDPGLARPRIQVSTWSTSYDQAESLSLEVKNTLQDFSGTTGGITINRIFFENEYDSPEIDSYTNKIIYQIAQDYIAWHA